MEHRWSMRKPVHDRITLNCPPIGILHANIRDVSLGGLFIDTDAALNINTPVELLFSAKEKSGMLKTDHIDALVVRKTKQGVGLMFHKFNSATFRILRKLLLSEE